MTIGRPKSDDPKVDIPSWKARQSTVDAFKKLKDEFPHISLSAHLEEAMKEYLIKVNNFKRLIRL